MTDQTEAPASAAPAPAVWNEAPYSFIFPVAQPNGETITNITIREPDAEALERIDALGIEEGRKPTVAQGRCIMEALAGLDDGALKKMHAKDFTALMELSGPFLEGAMGG